MIRSLNVKAYKERVHNVIDNISSWDSNSSPPLEYYISIISACRAQQLKSSKSYIFLFIRVLPVLLILKLNSLCWFFQMSILYVPSMINPLNSNPTVLSNTLKQLVDNLPTNCLSVFDHFVGLAFRGLIC